MITIIGGDFTRSWLSLPLSHGIKVKGGKKSTFSPLNRGKTLQESNLVTEYHPYVSIGDLAS